MKENVTLGLKPITGTGITGIISGAQMITDREGKQHERIEYAPYGEVWIEQKYEAVTAALPYRFTGKELDSPFAIANMLITSARTRTEGTPEETGLYYYGARCLDPKTSRWLSADPAMGDYLPSAPVDDEARKRNGNLPGQGGVFNYVNLHVYHYAGNNPVKYVDPDGKYGASMSGRLAGSNNSVYGRMK
jgi:RHS repeat-associated protein